MEMIVNYNSLCKESVALNHKAHKALIETLNKRGVESINVKTYMDNDLIDQLCFPQTDKNGYGVNVKVKTIYKGQKGEWLANVIDESEDDWGTLELAPWDFDTSDLIDILGAVESIFNVADEDYDGKVFGAGEDIEEEDIEDEDQTFGCHINTLLIVGIAIFCSPLMVLAWFLILLLA